MRELINILLVDDNQDFLEMLQDMLKEEDLSLRAVETVAGADKILTEFDVDCIVCDYNLPDTTGIEFLSSIRKAGLHTPFILISGHVTNEILHDAIRLGAFEVIEKPIRFDQLCQVALHAVNSGIQMRNMLERLSTKMLPADEYKFINNNLKTAAKVRVLNFQEMKKRKAKTDAA